MSDLVHKYVALMEKLDNLAPGDNREPIDEEADAVWQKMTFDEQETARILIRS